MTEEQSTDSTADAADAVTEASQAEEQASGPVGPGVASTTRNRPGTSEDDVESAKASADAAPNKPAATRVTAESTDDDRDGPTYRVSVPTFEGPLDLLLHLIQKHELDILEIPIAFITEKYLAYIKMMEGLSIDVAADYLVMAATLAHIKSKMLLPSSPDEEEDGLDEPEEDPRAELIRRLLEYQKYKNAAAELADRAVLGRDVFPRGIAVEQTTDPAPLAPVSLFKLMDAFQSVLERVSQNEEHQIDFERISITERITELTDLLRGRGRLSFYALFDGDRTRADIIVTFLAVLEMTRLRLTNVIQDGPYEEIHVELAVQDDEDGSDDDDALERPAARTPTASSRDEPAAWASAVGSSDEDESDDDESDEDESDDDESDEDESDEDESDEDESDDDESDEDESDDDESDEDESDEDESDEDESDEDESDEDESDADESDDDESDDDESDDDESDDDDAESDEPAYDEPTDEESEAREPTDESEQESDDAEADGDDSLSRSEAAEADAADGSDGRLTPADSPSVASAEQRGDPTDEAPDAEPAPSQDSDGSVDDDERGSAPDATDASQPGSTKPTPID
jgi:segregation and condensation protein A